MVSRFLRQSFIRQCLRCTEQSTKNCRGFAGCNVNDRSHMSKCMYSSVKWQQIHTRFSSTSAGQLKPDLASVTRDVIDATDDEVLKDVCDDFYVFQDFISEAEEKSMMDEIHPVIRRLRYEKDHWDDAILNYRETERMEWSQTNSDVFDRLRAVAFPPGTPQIAYVHILDLAEDGVIKPHIDSIRFCGSTISGISLLSDSVMRLALDKDKSRYADLLLSRRSLYIMTRKTRYDYTHEILGNDQSVFKGNPVQKTRRISVICRNEPKPEDAHPNC